MSTGLGKDFWVYRFVQIATALGYSASSIAAMWWVLSEFHEMIYVSYMMIPPLIISAIVQPFVAPAGDRYNKKTLMSFGLFIQIVIYFLATLAFLNNSMTLQFLIFFEVIATVGKIIFNTGAIGILPHIVEDEKITDGMNITDRINSTMSILGGVAGGTLVTLLGISNSFVFLTSCIFIAFVLCFFIRYKITKSSSPVKNNWFCDIRDGFLYTINNRVVCGFFLYSLIIGVALAPMIISFPYLIKEIGGLPPFFVGLLMSSMGLGVIVGSFCYSFANRLINKKTMVYFSSGTFFLALLLVSTIHSAFFVFVGQFLIGFSRNWINVTVDSMLLKYLPENLRTRVLSNLMFFATINMPIAMLASGFLMDVIGIYNILLIMSGVCFIAMVTIVSNKMVREFLSVDPDAAMKLLRD
jgi:MFS family permease